MSIRVYPDVPRIYVDMDGVIADFELECSELNVHPSQGKLIPGIFRNLPVMPGAINGVNQLLDMGFFLMCLTKIPEENPSAATDKILWLYDNFPMLKDYIIISPDKGCIGTKRDFLIDDFPHFANASNFPGTFLHFNGSSFKTWDDIIRYFAVLKIVQKIKHD